MKRLLTISIIATFAFSAPAFAEEPTAAVAAPLTECNDGIDNDGDGVADTDGVYPNGRGSEPLMVVDDGCADGTPNTELFTDPPKRLTTRGARVIAKQATDDVFRHSYRNSFYEKLECDFRSRTRQICVMFFAAGDYVYGAKITTYNFADEHNNEQSYGYHLRGWKFTHDCAEKRNPFKCASKRYKA